MGTTAGGGAIHVGRVMDAAMTSNAAIQRLLLLLAGPAVVPVAPDSNGSGDAWGNEGVATTGKDDKDEDGRDVGIGTGKEPKLGRGNSGA